MQNIRRIAWGTALRAVRPERAPAGGVREEPLRAAAALGGALELSSWRGRSGRRYVVGVHALSEAELFDVTEAVALAVRRQGEAAAEIVAIADAGPGFRPKARRAWLAQARAAGATELHVHRLAEGAPARAAVAADLAAEAPAQDPAQDPAETPAEEPARRDAPAPGR